MLVKRAIRKAFITTMSLFIIMTIYIIPIEDRLQTKDVSLEIEYVTSLGNHSIYLLDNNNYLVKMKILLDSNNLKDNIKTIISYLTSSNSLKYTDSLKPVIPVNTKLNNRTIIDKQVTLDFSKDILKVSNKLEKKMIEAIVYSLTELDDIEEVIIKVDNNTLDQYPNCKEKITYPLKRNFGINKTYQFTKTNNISKTVIYYLEKVNDDSYYVPVTAYKNDARDKIDIIIEELTTGYIYEPNLMSIVREDLTLLDKSINDKVMTLNFNDALFDSKGKVKEEVLYTIGYSVFDNYDVNVISYRVNNKEVSNLQKKKMP